MQAKVRKGSGSGPRKPARTTIRHGVARAISRAGLCSRSEAAARVLAGRVAVDGRCVRDPEHPTHAGSRIEVDGSPLGSVQRVYLALNKPRGLVTTASDERGRETVYRCFEGAGLPWLGPVGRLDKASEGLLLFSNDPAWAAAISDPERGPLKSYHVKIDRLPDQALLAALCAGIDDAGEHLRASDAQVLRTGERSSWLLIALDEGRNRQIRRLLAALECEVLRLVRVAIGPVELGELGKGAWRTLSDAEVRLLSVSRDALL